MKPIGVDEGGRRHQAEEMSRMGERVKWRGTDFFYTGGYRIVNI